MSEKAAIVAQLIASIGTVLVAILAIWGDKFREIFASPILHLGLKNPRGNLTLRANGKRTIYYHLDVWNKRNWSPAKSTRIVITGIEKKRPDGTFFPEPIVAPLQLTWAYSEFHELFPTIATSEVCDLGYLDEDSQRFSLALYVVPNNFRGYVSPGESMRISVKASAHNFETKQPLILEISWDGRWDSDLLEMEKHLVIREVE